MTHDPLRDLLCRTDTVAGAGPQADEEFGQRVRQIADRRRGRSIMVGGLATATLLLVLAWQVLPTSRTPDQRELSEDRPAAETRQVAAEDAELHRLRAEIERCENELDLLLAVRRRVAAERELSRLRRRPDTAQLLQEQTDRTAIIILCGADLKHRQFGLAESATNDYRRIVDRFPNTRWADLAAERLAMIGPQLPEESRP